MGCTKSKPETSAKGPTGAPSEVVGDGDVTNLENGKNWRLEPQRALNKFVKNASNDEVAFFSGDNSMFDYFQDDDFVELRTMLDEPLGRSHFIAHVDHYSRHKHCDLVRLWLLLHQYHNLENNDDERYDSAKNIYKLYFQVPLEQKTEAELFKAKSCLVSPEKGSKEEIEKAQSEYNRMLVPDRSQEFPMRVVDVIVRLRPTVERALQEAVNVGRTRPRKRSLSIGCFVDIPNVENALEPLSQIVDEGEESTGTGTTHDADTGDDGSGDSQERLASTTEAKKSETETDDQQTSPRGSSMEAREPLTYIRPRNSTSDDQRARARSGSRVQMDLRCPPLYLFIDLQNEVFKEMKPLYQHFKEDSDDYIAYKKSKKDMYNHVEPDDFDYVNILGKGGFGHVVYVKKKSTGRQYAMKVQAKDTLLHTWGGKMQHVEIERDVLVAHRSFPFIVSLRYAFQDDKYAFLCLDLAEQGSLRQAIAEAPGFQLEQPQVRLYVAEIVLALECLHAHEIIYRDLKPENVLLCNDGHILLADMGLAAFYYQDKYTDENDRLDRSDSQKLLDSITKQELENAEFLRRDSSANALSATGNPDEDKNEEEVDANEVDLDEEEGELSRDPPKRGRTMQSHDTDCGTPLYRPPEMIRQEHYGEGVDWFMLGVFTYECLVGHLPFEPKQDNPNQSTFEINSDEQELRVLRKKLIIPPHLDKATVQLLTGLLDLNQHTRLGVGPVEVGRDLDSLKDHDFFIPLAGPLATECDWEKVMNKEYKPVVVPEHKTMDEGKKKYPNFEALVRDWKKNAKKEVKEYAKKKKEKCDYNVPVLQEGKAIDKSLEHYFDNWDYIDPESINLEKKAAEEHGNSSGSSNRSIRNSIRSKVPPPLKKKLMSFTKKK
eukprot:CAMPEP_0203759820 /NCGR_PEP_ID=MMETSP0098-20131031/13058_1 /ASSEMBLY_ACC=CAM_ASM_000208 /TAXON_ID=96639 /ORGANISM=" , Strain NY0313808BC1" /LENGTH=884 /DNA_ID=CAMNT_0050653055 /DNA_START=329 /DNA_END=2980 /DNA_ORIENTATION=-